MKTDIKQKVEKAFIAHFLLTRKITDESLPRRIIEMNLTPWQYFLEGYIQGLEHGLSKLDR